ncbi:MAG: tetratricopeptide repeat protein, partial [Acidobacteriota bacterium]
MDRDDTLRRAEKLLRQGRLDAAIGEYAAVVEAFPTDWATANLLGDLFAKAGRTDLAAAQYGRIAELLAADGFLSKAAALFKKIIKLMPDDEQALLRTAELAAQQGLLADARHVLHALFQRRVRAGDRNGAAKIAARLAELDINDVVGRLDAARMLSEIGDTHGAADHLRLAGDMLVRQGREADAVRAWRECLRLNSADLLAQQRLIDALVRSGDLAAALAAAQVVADRRAIAQAMLAAGRQDDALAVLRQALAEETGHVETRLQIAALLIGSRQYVPAREVLTAGLPADDARIELALAEVELQLGTTDAAASILTAVLNRDASLAQAVANVGATLIGERPDSAFVAVECALDHLSSRGDLDSALKIIERFVAAVPRHQRGLERFAQVCRDGRFDDLLYRVESELTEAYLMGRRFAEALVLAQRLAAIRPDVGRHAAQILEARAGMAPAGSALPELPALPQSTIGESDLAEFMASLGLPVHREDEPLTSLSPSVLSDASMADAPRVSEQQAPTLPPLPAVAEPVVAKVEPPPAPPPPSLPALPPLPQLLAIAEPVVAKVELRSPTMKLPPLSQLPAIAE